MTTAEHAKQLILTDGANPAPVCSAFSQVAEWEIPFDGWSITKYAKFLAYHKAHKFIWLAFKDLANELIADGEQHYSADALLHVVRFQCRREKKQGEEFKVNNNFSCGYARAFERKYPQHKGFFETREVISEAA